MALEQQTIPRTRRASPAPPARTPDERRPASPDQHSLARSIVLHLAPGAALMAFVLGGAALGVPAVVALLIGIAVVVIPIELGYLLVQARRTSGRWSLSEVVTYREPLPPRRIAFLAVLLVAWFIVLLMLSVGVLDQRIADSLFSWYPESVREFASVEGDAEYSTRALLLFFGAAFLVNGVLGPVVEELYFRGYLLPRIDRLGRRAPVLNAVLFSLYHLWTPWQNPGRIVALVPWIYAVWRTRSLRLSIAVHVSVNCIFLLLAAAAVASSR